MCISDAVESRKGVCCGVEQAGTSAGAGDQTHLIDTCTAAPPAWIERMNSNREQMIRLIRKTVQSGGAVFVGPGSVLQQVGLA